MSWYQWTAIGMIVVPVASGFLFLWLTRPKRNHFKHDPCWSQRNLRGSDFK